MVSSTASSVLPLTVLPITRLHLPNVSSLFILLSLNCYFPAYNEKVYITRRLLLRSLTIGVSAQWLLAPFFRLSFNILGNHRFSNHGDVFFVGDWFFVKFSLMIPAGIQKSYTDGTLQVSRSSVALVEQRWRLREKPNNLHPELMLLGCWRCCAWATEALWLNELFSSSIRQVAARTSLSVALPLAFVQNTAER